MNELVLIYLNMFGICIGLLWCVLEITKLKKQMVKK